MHTRTHTHTRTRTRAHVHTHTPRTHTHALARMHTHSDLRDNALGGIPSGLFADMVEVTSILVRSRGVGCAGGGATTCAGQHLVFTVAQRSWHTEVPATPMPNRER